MSFQNKVFDLFVEEVKQAADEIGFPYDDGVLQQVEMDLYHKLNTSKRTPLNIMQFTEVVENVIEEWKSETQENFPEYCSK